ncbi:SO2930 family diheme c-type cytochrome [Paraliomyxa miuraensis]|uniref:SO2930 family diheme c-type cytochrome n=1 Tax=Paraliomyxa miuraensis TaxID=376150 RepID=UPI00224CF512|nr:SO2930 family diheme c-type cytochrome [Paraliomyxa miuraensis]MCX4240994.1 hypothetical protein [Paraliomyxa miuraensis]
MRTRTLVVVGLGAVALVSGCTEPAPPPEEAPRPVVDLDQLPYETLSEYGFFVGEMVDAEPAPGVLPYTVAAPLWADAAHKGRYIVLPEGQTLQLTERDEWLLPVGTVIIKSFFVDLDHSQSGTDGPETDLLTIETRLLVHEEDRWHSYIYRWNDEQTEATRLKAGADVRIQYTDEAGEPAEQIYIIPDENTCGSCHERDDVLRVLGLTTAQMNVEVERDGQRVSQLQWLADQGAIDGLPDPATLEAYPDPAGDAPLEARARAYLHGNCSHCHRPGGGGGSSGLKFYWWETDPAQFGVCKVPAAAGPGTGGHAFDILPGHPEQSIVVHRMASTDPEIKMPELPSLLADDFGVRLVSEWIAAMPEDDCGG